MSLQLPVLDTSGSGPLTGPWGDRFAIIRRYDDPRFGARASAREVRSGSDMVVGTMQCPSWAHERVTARLGQLAELEHPKIATLDWQLVGDQLSLARRDIIGRTVADHLVEQRALPLGMFVPIASQILMAVGHAHRHGVATGPIDPQDVVLRVESGRQLAVVLTDFGLAEALWPVLRAGQPPQPRAPELDAAEPATPASDVYALGTLFAHLLLGGQTWPTPASTIERACFDASLPPALVELIEDMLGPADRRPANAEEVVEQLIDAVPKTLFRLPRAGASSTEIRAENSFDPGMSQATLLPTLPGDTLPMGDTSRLIAAPPVALLEPVASPRTRTRFLVAGVTAIALLAIVFTVLQTLPEPAVPPVAEASATPVAAPATVPVVVPVVTPVVHERSDDSAIGVAEPLEPETSSDAPPPPALTVPPPPSAETPVVGRRTKAPRRARSGESQPAAEPVPRADAQLPGPRVNAERRSNELLGADTQKRRSDALLDPRP